IWGVPSSRPTGVVSGYGGKCAEVAGAVSANGTVVQLNTCGTGSAQSSNGTLVGTQSGRCLDATGPSSANGTKLQIWACAASDNQLWKLPA
ncbi:RICIN domain-containing protein, partial [Streptomyces sp. NRRL S-340]|uniref:RICIN domain-containing protein n=1 Tax=Streptomyces sp. NRRL S-340 TaxID=1463901 RepID=UPI0018FE31DC